MDKQAEDRKKRNADVLAKFKRGETLSLCPPSDTWFPDRSKGFIKKDPKAVKELYGVDLEKPKLSVVKDPE